MSHRKEYLDFSEDDKKEAYHLQTGRCAICLDIKHIDELYIDHDHETDMVRGLLCCNCNTGIGQLKDSPRILKRAISYLIVNGKTRRE
jgi:hypothetical protein